MEAGGVATNRDDRGTSLIRNSPPPQDHHRILGIVLLQGPRGALFLMSEVHLHSEQAPPRVLQSGYDYEHCATLGAVRVPSV